MAEGDTQREGFLPERAGRAFECSTGRVRGLTSNGATSLAYQQQDGDFRYFIAVINEDRRAKGLPLIEFE